MRTGTSTLLLFLRCPLLRAKFGTECGKTPLTMLPEQAYGQPGHWIRHCRRSQLEMLQSAE